MITKEINMKPPIKNMTPGDFDKICKILFPKYIILLLSMLLVSCYSRNVNQQLPTTNPIIVNQQNNEIVAWYIVKVYENNQNTEEVMSEKLKNIYGDKFISFKLAPTTSTVYGLHIKTNNPEKEEFNLETINNVKSAKYYGTIIK
jgi:hypothetical protein